jgi:hypothetical protein
MYEGVVSVSWIGKDVKGSGLGLILCTAPSFAWSGWGKSRKTLISMVELRAEIWNRNLANMKQECYIKSYSCSQWKAQPNTDINERCFIISGNYF